jgi:glycine/D-amino acid oxidase-like deaminating enzyme
VKTPFAQVRARRVALGTNAFPPLLRRMRHYVVPVYDYALMTEPLTTEQLASIGWRHRQGIDDCGNQFHYYRLTSDNRILWGGYDAIYHWRNRVAPELERRERTYELLAQHFFETFPQLEGLRFPYRWGGAIDTSTQFCAFFGTARAIALP